VAEEAGDNVDAAEAAAAKPAKPTPITAKSLHSAMQKAAVKYRADKNHLVNDQRFTTMRDELVKEFGNPTITYRVKIRRIDWKDGLVSLLTDSPLPDVKPTLLDSHPRIARRQILPLLFLRGLPSFCQLLYFRLGREAAMSLPLQELHRPWPLNSTPTISGSQFRSRINRRITTDCWASGYSSRMPT
jgi:hypothetical protein